MITRSGTVNVLPCRSMVARIIYSAAASGFGKTKREFSMNRSLLCGVLIGNYSDGI